MSNPYQNDINELKEILNKEYGGSNSLIEQQIKNLESYSGSGAPGGIGGGSDPISNALGTGQEILGGAMQIMGMYSQIKAQKEAQRKAKEQRLQQEEERRRMEAKLKHDAKWDKYAQIAQNSKVSRPSTPITQPKKPINMSTLKKMEMLRRNAGSAANTKPLWGRAPENIKYDKSENVLSGEKLWGVGKVLNKAEINRREYQKKVEENNLENERRRKNLDEEKARVREGMKKLAKLEINLKNDILDSLPDDLKDNLEIREALDDIDIDLKLIQNESVEKALEIFTGNILNKLKPSLLKLGFENPLSIDASISRPLETFSKALQKINNEFGF